MPVLHDSERGTPADGSQAGSDEGYVRLTDAAWCSILPTSTSNFLDNHTPGLDYSKGVLDEHED